MIDGLHVAPKCFNFIYIKVLVIIICTSLLIRSLINILHIRNSVIFVVVFSTQLTLMKMNAKLRNASGLS